jgi:hypothetical protein
LGQQLGLRIANGSTIGPLNVKPYDGPILYGLTPKGLNVHVVTKPVLVCVASAHTIFRFFETFCEDASRMKLHVSANFMILGIMVQKLWVFEVFGQGLARAGMCWSQLVRVDHFHKKWRAG